MHLPCASHSCSTHAAPACLPQARPTFFTIVERLLAMQREASAAGEGGAGAGQGGPLDASTSAGGVPGPVGPGVSTKMPTSGVMQLDELGAYLRSSSRMQGAPAVMVAVAAGAPTPAQAAAGGSPQGGDDGADGTERAGEGKGCKQEPQGQAHASAGAGSEAREEGRSWGMCTGEHELTPEGDHVPCKCEHMPGLGLRERPAEVQG